MKSNPKEEHNEPAKSKKAKTIENSTPDGSGFPVVGVGASAGGLEALELFFENMPPNCGMAFVVIQHLDPTHVGIMPELLQRITDMKVTQASDELKVQPNHVYVIPPNKSLAILNGTLHLFQPVESRGLRLPIDIFFRSLADDMHDKSIGVVLSGMGSDGSIGLKAIKESNGVVLVQEPTSAKFDSMPRSAIEAVMVDIIAPANELPHRLIDFLKFTPAAVVPEPDREIKDKSNLDKIIILLREQSGHDFSLYKKNTLIRRIDRRKGIHQIDKIQSYVRFLQENPKEVDILFKELLIGVTGFFRDPDVWEKFKDTILLDLVDKLPDGYTLRAWVTGCSTGEEAYTLAMIFKEVIEKSKKSRGITLQIFATDIDVEAIDKARKGFFHSNITTEVSPERLKKFFKAENDGYYVNSSLREMIVFAVQNVIKDPPFTRLDILTCRNMLIYMEPELQKKLLSLFHYSLNLEGMMILGSAETIGSHTAGFDVIDSKLKLFKRRISSEPTELIDFPSSFYHSTSVSKEPKSFPKSIDNIQALTDQILLKRFAPASVLVNEKGDIIYITGRTGKYLEPVAGKANWNIHAMARNGLRVELPGAFRKAKLSYDPIILKNIKIADHHANYFVDVTVQSIDSPESLKGFVIVVFSDVPAVVGDDAVNQISWEQSSPVRQKELEIQLQRCFEDLQTSREEMQTSQEELHSTNEELQSTNEELQSTNEELTTSKEEMQSLNEELQTVNNELQSKLADFVHANDDMKNLLNSTEIATLFLDKDLNIRRFTDHVVKIFKLRMTDVGRPFTDLVTDLIYPDIGGHASQVLKTLVFIESAITTNDDRWFNVRIMPYRTIDDRIDGLVITFTDITNSKKLEMELREATEAVKKQNIK